MLLRALKHFSSRTLKKYTRGALRAGRNTSLVKSAKHATQLFVQRYKRNYKVFTLRVTHGTHRLTKVLLEARYSCYYSTTGFSCSVYVLAHLSLTLGTFADDRALLTTGQDEVISTRLLQKASNTIYLSLIHI